MRTTIRLNDELLAEVKLYAARTGKTLTSVIEDALHEMLARQGRASKRASVRVTTVRGHGLQSGIDLDDSAALLSRMEEADDSA